MMFENDRKTLASIIQDAEDVILDILEDGYRIPYVSDETRAIKAVTALRELTNKLRYEFGIQHEVDALYETKWRGREI